MQLSIHCSQLGLMTVTHDDHVKFLTDTLAGGLDQPVV